MNNFHPNAPALMSDGRSFSNWQPTAVLNEQIRKREKLQSNWAYRQYLQNNANSIIEFDQSTACHQTGCPYAYVSKTRNPFESSDLKDSYVSSQASKFPFSVNKLPIDA
jgi:hypothetical protein